MKLIKHQRSILNMRAMLILLICMVVLLEVALAFSRLSLFFASMPIVIAVISLAVWMIWRANAEQRLFLRKIAAELGTENREALYQFPMPIVVCSKDGTIVWYNDLFHDEVALGVHLTNKNFSLISGEKLNDFCNRTGVQIQFKGNYYHVHAVRAHNSEIYVLYFENNTTLIKIANEYKLSKPSVLLFMIDNYEEIFEDKKESEKSAILGAIDEDIERFIGQTTGFFKRLSHDRFLAVVEDRHLQTFIRNRFPILNDVRSISKDERTPITLSIGVGCAADTLAESEIFARQALDMALGRGGDQAAVKTNSGFEFYGGVSKGIEKRTKVKTRIIATALAEFIEQSDKIFVMGHRFGDLDCMGASIGMARAIQLMGKPCHIAVDYNKNLATSLLDRIKESGNGDLFIQPDNAISQVTPKTLLIIIDTHNPDFIESPALYLQCENVVVIDHHRKMVRYIEPTVIFYHEPYASSASEMVTELIQYMGDFKLGALEAEGLLAGIMLDTKNFVIKTGVRTFEAAAYLKQLGADTVAVRKLFSNTIDAYQKKTRIVSNAETYRNCAIAIGDFKSEDMRIVAPQAADELLGISGVDASFVLYVTGSTVNISSRSLGAVNAQLIMESLGGGGHQTMAACQMENTNLENARQLLLEAIDRYLEQHPKKES